ncbi:hypothetical protein [Streptomyces iconiensis]|uniref:Major facilitator superfamily (MFS) profile domain-containing protein n=1 Tax=Streptomyces iconiensis TaxID=1384038 RepID=A0ABT7A731_9ACTN|nr:hypothetical protein [Streptomyces iconiensis]MDJ1136824.1 hypothetical protein [Streptomyces iconiensis]
MGTVPTAAPTLAVGFGLGVIGAPLADLTLGKVAHHQAGSASGLFNTATQLGIALGTALITVIFFTRLSAGPREEFSDDLRRQPRGPPAVADHGRARPPRRRKATVKVATCPALGPIPDVDDTLLAYRESWVRNCRL